MKSLRFIRTADVQALETFATQQDGSDDKGGRGRENRQGRNSNERVGRWSFEIKRRIPSSTQKLSMASDNGEGQQQQQANYCRNPENLPPSGSRQLQGRYHKGITAVAKGIPSLCANGEEPLTRRSWQSEVLKNFAI